MNKTYTVTEQIDVMRSRGRTYLVRIEGRIKKLEETVFQSPPPVEPRSRLQPIALLARIDRLEAAVGWREK